MKAMQSQDLNSKHKGAIKERFSPNGGNSQELALNESHIQERKSK